MKTVEQKLYEAFRKGCGIRLTAEDVDRLMLLDDAVRTRISNVACEQAGVEQEGYDIMGGCQNAPTWTQFVKSLAES